MAGGYACFFGFDHDCQCNQNADPTSHRGCPAPQTSAVLDELNLPRAAERVRTHSGGFVHFSKFPFNLETLEVRWNADKYASQVGGGGAISASSASGSAGVRTPKTTAKLLTVKAYLATEPPTARSLSARNFGETLYNHYISVGVNAASLVEAISVLDKHTIDCSKTNAHACTPCCRRYWFPGGGGVIELVLHRHIWYTPIFIAFWKAGVFKTRGSPQGRHVHYKSEGHGCGCHLLPKDASSKPGKPSRDGRPVPNSLTLSSDFEFRTPKNLMIHGEPLQGSATLAGNYAGIAGRTRGGGRCCCGPARRSYASECGNAGRFCCN